MGVRYSDSVMGAIGTSALELVDHLLNIGLFTIPQDSLLEAVGRSPDYAMLPVALQHLCAHAGPL
jgi:hypothetical protein